MIPVWLPAARQFIGQAEVAGAKAVPLTARAWLWLRAKFGAKDATASGGAFIAKVLDNCKLSPPKDFYRASAWLSYGNPCPEPVVGCVVVFCRGIGSHVGLVVGVDQYKNLMVLTKRHGAAVAIEPFAARCAVDYRLPVWRGLGTESAELPRLISNASGSLSAW